MPAIACASLIAFALNGAFGQPPTEHPAFEVASIRIWPGPFQGGEIGIKLSPGGVAMRYTKLWACLAWAYDIPGRVLGPDWIYSERYDIVAKAAGPVSETQAKRMMQTLLVDRFKLTLHRETRELPVAALVVGKNGTKNLHAVDPGGRLHTQRADGKLVLKNVSMSSFAGALNGRPPYGVNETVVDKTGLTGVFDITLDVKQFNLDDPAFNGNFEELQRAIFNFISTAIEKQYGLKLEHRKLPLESLVIDGGNHVPADN